MHYFQIGFMCSKVWMSQGVLGTRTIEEREQQKT